MECLAIIGDCSKESGDLQVSVREISTAVTKVLRLDGLKRPKINPISTMKAISIVGARPQFITATAMSHHVHVRHAESLVHTGQHDDYRMSGVFFEPGCDGPTSRARGRVIGRGTAAMSSVESTEPLGLETALPAADVVGRTGQLGADRAPAQPLLEHHDQPGTLHISRRRTARTCEHMEHTALFPSQTEVRVHASHETTDINVTGQ